VELVPLFFRESALQVELGLNDVLSVRELPPLREPVDVGVDGEGRHAEGLAHHDRGGLVPDSREGFE
jgi:hypothetical protein